MAQPSSPWETENPGSEAGSQASMEVEAVEAEEFAFGNEDDGSPYPPNLNIVSLRQVSPGDWTMISEDEHLDNHTGLLLRRQRHVDNWNSEPLLQVQGNTVLPALEAS